MYKPTTRAISGPSLGAYPFPAHLALANQRTGRENHVPIAGVSAELVAVGMLAAWWPKLHVQQVRADIANAVLLAYRTRRIRLPHDVLDALSTP